MVKAIIRLRAKFFKSRFYWKMFISYIFMCIIPVLLILLMSIFVFKSYIEKNIDRITRYNINNTATNISNAIDKYKNLLYAIVNDDEMNNLFLNYRGDKKIFIKNDILYKFVVSIYPYKEIKNIIYISNDFDNIQYNKLTGYTDKKWYTLDEASSIYQKVNSQNKVVFLHTDAFANKYDDTRTDINVFYIGIKVIDLKSFDPIGVLVLEIDESILKKHFNPQYEKMGISDLSITQYIIDEEGRFVSARDTSVFGSKITDIYKFDRLFKAKNITHNVEIGDIGWVLVNIIDKNKIFYEANLFQNTLLICGFIIILVFFFTMNFAVSNYTKSLKYIIRGMEEVESGKLSVKLDTESKDEFFFIAVQFNRMMDKINFLMAEVEKQKKDIFYALTKQKEAEIRSLEAQINPHFIYNTLDHISWSAIEKEAYDISGMIGKLARILRYSINRSNEITTIHQEVEWLKNYLTLYQHRYNFVFNYQIEVEEDIQECLIHKLLFQPIIENALVHGMALKKEGGMLWVRIKKIEMDVLEIIVQDNGSGIAKDKLVNIIKKMQSCEALSKDSIGIYNVFNRVKLYYGDKGEVFVESTEGEGTLFKVYVPLQQAKDNTLAPIE